MRRTDLTLTLDGNPNQSGPDDERPALIKAKLCIQKSLFSLIKDPTIPGFVISKPLLEYRVITGASLEIENSNGVFLFASLDHSSEPYR
jgi:hypothetical protein